MTIITVHKLNLKGEIVVTYQGELAEHLPDGVRLDARWTRPPLPLGYTTFAPGDRFVEWYYTDRWYNIFEIHATGDDRLKGWYCNVAEPARIEGETIACRDLFLDLWVAPDGATRILDEDEFAAADLDSTTRDAALAALQELQRLVRERRHPFDAIPAVPA
jgi:uncharacterized protein